MGAWGPPGFESTKLYRQESLIQQGSRTSFLCLLRFRSTEASRPSGDLARPRAVVADRSAGEAPAARSLRCPRCAGGGDDPGMPVILSRAAWKIPPPRSPPPPTDHTGKGPINLRIGEGPASRSPAVRLAKIRVETRGAPPLPRHRPFLRRFLHRDLPSSTYVETFPPRPRHPMTTIAAVTVAPFVLQNTDESLSSISNWFKIWIG